MCLLYLEHSTSTLYIYNIKLCTHLNSYLRAGSIALLAALLQQLHSGYCIDCITLVKDFNKCFACT